MSLLVRHVMTPEVRTAGSDMSASDAAGLMASYGVGSIPIVDGEELLGIVTDRDLVIRVLASRDDPEQVRLADVLTGHDLATVTPDTQVSEARDLMANKRVRRLPVVKDGKLVGIVSLGDVALADASKRAVGETLSEVSESESTMSHQESPPRGTPDRVRDAREARDRS
jgi:CBS domain-containing protein